MSAKETMQKMVALDEKIGGLREEFDEFSEQERDKVLSEEFDRIMKEIGEYDPMPVSLFRVADLLSGLSGDRPAEILAKGLDHENPDVRLLSGETLLQIAEEGLDRIMTVVDEAVAKGGIMAREMPFLLIDVDDPGVPDAVERFLKSEDAEVVASAIEALAELGDPSSIPALKKLFKDKRTVSVEEEGEVHEEWTVGKLAEEAVEEITGGDE